MFSDTNANQNTGMTMMVNEQSIMPLTTTPTGSSDHTASANASSPREDPPGAASSSCKQQECSGVTQVESNAVAKAAADGKENVLRSRLLRLSRDKGLELDSEAFSALLDALDPLAHLRQEFCFPLCRTLPSGMRGLKLVTGQMINKQYSIVWAFIQWRK